MATAKEKKIQELREARRLTIEALGRGAGVDGRTLRQWEAGERPIDLARLPKLAETLGVSQDEIRLEENRRHHVAGVHRFVLQARGDDAAGWTAIAIQHNPTAAFSPGQAYPDPATVAIGGRLHDLRGAGATRDEAFSSLANQIDEAMATIATA